MTTQEEQDLWQAAKNQQERLEEMLLTSLQERDEKLAAAMKDCCSSVTRSIEEGFKRPASLHFRKNFLVIAKSFNNEYGLLLEQVVNKEYWPKEITGSLLEKNRTLQQRLQNAVRTFQLSCVDEGKAVSRATS
jgi:four helix bundle protein